MTPATEQFIALREALADILVDEWERLAAYLFRQRRKALTLWGDEDEFDDLLDDYDQQPLAQAFQQPAVVDSLAQAFTAGAGRAEAQMGIVWGARNAYALDYARQRAAEMVGMRRLPNGQLVPNPSARWRITDYTRDELKRLVLDTMEGAESYRDLKEQIEALPAFGGLFGEYRAEAIARTELAIAVNQGHFETYEQMGIEYVRVHDGAECGWLNHDDPDRADGSIRTLAEARDHPLSHPNCRRAFSSWRPEKAANYDSVYKMYGPFPVRTIYELEQSGYHPRPGGSFAKEGDSSATTTAGITAETGLTGYRLEEQRSRFGCARCAQVGYCRCQAIGLSGCECSIEKATGKKGEQGHFVTVHGRPVFITEEHPIAQPHLDTGDHSALARLSEELMARTAAERLKPGDAFLRELAKEQGFHGQPHVITKEQLDRYVAKGERELFSGVTRAEFAEAFRSGEYFASQDGFGSGIYVVYGPEGRKVAEQYAETTEGPGAILRMSLKRGAKIVASDKLETELQREREALQQTNPQLFQKLRPIYENPGRFALVKGFDAIDVPKYHFMVIMNRTAVRVEEEVKQS